MIPVIQLNADSVDTLPTVLRRNGCSFAVESRRPHGSAKTAWGSKGRMHGY
jgi:hypothetical protein